MDKRIWTKIVSWVALVSFVGVIILSVVFSTVGAQKSSSEIRKDIDNAKNKQIQNAQLRKQLDAEISEVSKQIYDTQLSIDSIQEKIDLKEQELLKAKEESEKQNLSYQKRVKLMVEKGSVSYLEVILNAKSFADLLTRAEVVKAIAEYDNTILQKLKEVEALIEQLKTELEEEKSKIEIEKADLETQKQTLELKIAENDSLMRELEKDIEKYEEEYKKAKAEEEAAWERSRGLVSQNTVYTGGQFYWPATVSTITSYHGYRIHPVTKKKAYHAGIDIGASRGSNIFAANDGTVIVAGWNSGYGNYIMIDHGGGYVTLYGHNDALLVKAGQKVKRGEVIAKCGSTGVSTGPHLHFEIRINGTTVDPLPYLK